MRLKLDETADRGRGIFAHGKPHPLRPVSEPPVTFDALNTHGNAVAALALLADFDEAGQSHARRRVVQNRMGHDLGAQCSGRKAGRAGGKAERERKADGAPPRQNRGRGPSGRQGDGSPPRRFAIRGEIDDDAEAIGDRKPGHQPAWRDFGKRPFRDRPAKPRGAVREPLRQDESGPSPGGIDLSRPSPGACPLSPDTVEKGLALIDEQ